MIMSPPKYQNGPLNVGKMLLVIDLAEYNLKYHLEELKYLCM